MKHAERKEIARRIGAPFQRLPGSKTPFKRIAALVEAVNKATSDAERTLTIVALHAYRSRGHGRGSLSPRFGSSRSKYKPHQGARECAKRKKYFGYLNFAGV